MIVNRLTSNVALFINAHLHPSLEHLEAKAGH